MSNNIKQFWLLTLCFKSALHIGRGSSDAFMGAAEIVENGAGRYMIPGTSIAGVFFSTLKNCVKPTDRTSKLWRVFTGDGRKRDDDSSASWLVFRSAELEPKVLQVRDRVNINRKTKTAKEGAKFSLWELIPNDLKVLIEFDNMTKATSLNDEDCNQIREWVDAVFFSWHKEGFFLGAHSGTGNGYIRLVDVQQCELTKDNLPIYLDSSYADIDNAEMGWQSCKPQKPNDDSMPAFTRKYSIRVKVDYQNPLLIKGGLSYLSHANPETDAPFMNREGRPFIPGSSIRGAISSFMDKYSKTNWKILLGQPLREEQKPDKGGYIVFTDLNIIGDDADIQKKLIKIERHAEDQFSRAIFGSGKFDEERLFNSEFEGRIFVISGAPISTEELDKLFAFLQSGLKLSMISLGAGSCYPSITMEEIS